MDDKDILFIGTAIVDSIIKGFDPEPVSVTGYRADSCSLNVGGEAVNGSIAAAKLGMKPAILCHLGRDAAGDMIGKELEKQGVDTRLIIRSDGRATPVTTMFVKSDGSRKSITNKAHKYNFHPERYLEALEGAKAVVLGSLFRAPFDDPKVVRTIAEEAKKNGALVFADTKLQNFSDLTLDDFRDSLGMIDYITPNEDEGWAYTGEDDPEKMADAFLSAGARNVIIKLGEKGCFFRNSEESVYLPAYDIDAADACGAGDTFLAGFASEILKGSTVKDALSFANACAAVCCTMVGACTALRGRDQVMKFMAENREKR